LPISFTLKGRSNTPTIVGGIISLIAKVIILVFVSFKFKRIYDQEASRLSLVKSQNVITTPSNFNVTNEDL